MNNTLHQTDNQLLHLFDQMNAKPIAFYSVYAKITGSITAGLLLSQLVYWSKAMQYREFYKTDADLCEELCMGLYELKGAKKRLQELNLVTITRRGTPPKSFYLLNMRNLLALIIDCGKTTHFNFALPQNQISKKPTINTENNTENNTDTNPPYIPPCEGGTQNIKKPVSQNSKQVREACRLPDDVTLSAEWAKIAKDAGIHRDYTANTFQRFRNFWTEKEGKQALKKDWRKAWQNWCLTDAARGMGTRPPQKIQKSLTEQIFEMVADDDTSSEMEEILSESKASEGYEIVVQEILEGEYK
jgi:hypothetical protein